MLNKQISHMFTYRLLRFSLVFFKVGSLNGRTSTVLQGAAFRYICLLKRDKFSWTNGPFKIVLETAATSEGMAMYGYVLDRKKTR